MSSKISNLPSGTTPTASDEFVSSRSGSNFKYTYTQLAPTATTSIRGMVQLAPNINTTADASNAVTPANIASKLGPQTLNTILIGNGLTNSFSSSNVGTNGQVLIANSSGAPAFATIASSDSSITLTGGANTLDAKSNASIPFSYAISDETTALTTGINKLEVRAPYACNITLVRASLTTASSSGTPTFNIYKNGTTIFSTLLTINVSQKTSVTASVAYVLSATSFADDDIITFGITTAGTGTAGAKITLYLKKP